MTRRCLLHIGAPKTGSTALEIFLSENRQVLAGYGWGYPAATSRGFGHHDLAYLVSGTYPDWALPQEKSFDDLLVTLAPAIADKPGIILSSEIFYLYAKPEDVADMLERLDIPVHNTSIVLYIRRQDDAHLSWYNQRVKAQGYAGTLHESIEEHRGLWDYEHKLALWSDVFGEKNIHVRIFHEDKLVNRDVRSDFLHILDVPANNFTLSANEINTRLCRDVLEFQRIINKLPLTPVQKRRYHSELMALSNSTCASDLFEDQPLLDTSGREQILEQYSGSNKAVARRFFGLDQLFDETMPVSAATDTSCELNVEKVTAIIGWLLAR